MARHTRKTPPKRNGDGGWWFLALALFAAAIYLTTLAYRMA